MSNLYLFKNQNIKAINNYSLKDIKSKDHFSFTLPIRELQMLSYIKNNATITLVNRNKYDETEYINNVIKIIKELSKCNKTYNVVIDINNRELLRQSNILNTLPQNINLSIVSDDYIYKLDEYKKDEEKLEALVKPIREANLSPLEKYLAVYNIVKNFKPYKKSEEDRRKDRSLRYILDDDNKYIVCSGFSRLLTELLNRINIPSKFIFLAFEPTSNKDSANKNKEYIEHARNLIKIDDDKYNVHGYYLADSTWDNNQEFDLYLNSILTFDRKKEARYQETLEDEDLLLDFHNVDEFKEKIKYFIKKRISYPKINASAEENLRKKAYKDLYLKIIDIVSQIDKDKYYELYNKYDTLINIDMSDTTSNKLETVMTNLLFDWAKYIIPLSNNKISLETILRAVIETKQTIYKMEIKDIKIWLEKTLYDNTRLEEQAFPYIYDKEDSRESYLQERTIPRK